MSAPHFLQSGYWLVDDRQTAGLRLDGDQAEGFQDGGGDDEDVVVGERFPQPGPKRSSAEPRDQWTHPRRIRSCRAAATGSQAVVSPSGCDTAPGTTGCRPSAR